MDKSIILDDYLFIRTERNEKGKSVIDFPNDYYVVDIETTGLSPIWDSIIEIGAIHYQNYKEINRFHSLVQPPVEIDNGVFINSFIESLTGITNAMLDKAPSINTVIKDFDSFIGTNAIIGYNVSFDINFLYDAFVKYLGKPLTNNYIDIMRFSRKLYPDLQHHRLKDMKELYGITVEREHRALFDIIATEKCYELMKAKALEQYGSLDDFKKAFKSHSNSKYSLCAKDIKGNETKTNIDSPLYNRRCVFTGKLEKLTRKEAMQIVADLGGINEDNITKKTNYLILGNNDYCTTIKEGKSNKQKCAEKYKLEGQDIEIIPETVFYDMIGDEYKEIDE